MFLFKKFGYFIHLFLCVLCVKIFVTFAVKIYLKKRSFLNALGMWRAPKAVRTGTSAAMGFVLWFGFF